MPKSETPTRRPISSCRPIWWIRHRLDLYGEGWIDFRLPELPLSGGQYYVMSYVESDKEVQDWIHNASLISVSMGTFMERERVTHQIGGENLYWSSSTGNNKIRLLRVLSK